MLNSRHYARDNLGTRLGQCWEVGCAYLERKRCYRQCRALGYVENSISGCRVVSPRRHGSLVAQFGSDGPLNTAVSNNSFP